MIRIDKPLFTGNSLKYDMSYGDFKNIRESFKEHKYLLNPLLDNIYFVKEYTDIYINYIFFENKHIKKKLSLNVITNENRFDFITKEDYSFCEFFPIKTKENRYFIGVSKDSIMYFGEDHSLQSVYKKVFYGEIKFSDISTIDERNGIISFKEKSSGLYMFITGLSNIENLLVFNVLKDRCSNKVIY